MIAIDLSKQKELDADPKRIQQINFTKKYVNLEMQYCFSLLKKQNKPFWIFLEKPLEYYELISV